ncbi:MAG TPA: hypothetical protein VMC09_10050, partial [Anaerolineales bacterium]|nr:hypothetical protein [Anaerolineales bacterium]
MEILRPLRLEKAFNINIFVRNAVHTALCHSLDAPRKGLPFASLYPFSQAGVARLPVDRRAVGRTVQATFRLVWTDTKGESAMQHQGIIFKDLKGNEVDILEFVRENKIKAVFFDLGDTLVEIRPETKTKIVQRINNECGLKIDSTAFDQATREEWKRRESQ